MGKKEVSFEIKIQNANALKGMKAFSGELQQMKKGIADLNKSLGTKAGAEKMKKTTQSLTTFMKSLDRIGGKTKYFKGFEKVASAIEKISSGLDYAGVSSKKLSGVADVMMEMGTKLNESKESTRAFNDALRDTGKSLKDMSKIGKGKFDSIANMFNKMALAGQSGTSGGLTRAIRMIVDSKKDILSVSRSIRMMATSLESTGATGGARRIVGGTIGMGGGGGGSGAIGTPMAGVDWGIVSGRGKNVYETIQKQSQ